MLAKTNVKFLINFSVSTKKLMGHFTRWMNTLNWLKLRTTTTTGDLLAHSPIFCFPFARTHTHSLSKTHTHTHTFTFLFSLSLFFSLCLFLSLSQEEENWRAAAFTTTFFGRIWQQQLQQGRRRVVEDEKIRLQQQQQHIKSLLFTEARTMKINVRFEWDVTKWSFLLWQNFSFAYWNVT